MMAGFTTNMVDAKILASEMDIEPKFPIKHKGKRKKHFDKQDDEDEEIQQSTI